MKSILSLCLDSLFCNYGTNKRLNWCLDKHQLHGRNRSLLDSEIECIKCNCTAKDICLIAGAENGTGSNYSLLACYAGVVSVDAVDYSNWLAYVI